MPSILKLPPPMDAQLNEALMCVDAADRHDLADFVLQRAHHPAKPLDERRLHNLIKSGCERLGIRPERP